MPKLIQITKPGGPDVLQLADLPAPKPQAGEALIRQNTIGVNFIDIYHRTGLYKLSSYPAGIGLEGAGVVEAVGEGVNNVKSGDRVAYSGGPIGAYAEVRTIPARWLIKIPGGISDDVAAASMVKGMTAWYLLTRTFKLEKRHTLLIHAVAGGVGLLVCQWAKHIGAHVIGTVSSDEKAALAKQHGCDEAIVYTREQVSKRVRNITAGQGVDVVYDSVGQTTFMDSLDCLKPLGMMISFGQASGTIPPFDIGILAQKGSLFLTRPSLMHYIAEESAYRAGAAELFDLMVKKRLNIHVGTTYKLTDAAQAHRDLEARKTTGSIILIVN